MNRRPCGCCGTCGWDCDVPTTICWTIEVCGQTVIVDPAELQFGTPPNPIYFVEHCYWYHYEPLTFDDEYSTQYNCTYDGRTDGPYLCPLDPESPSGYAPRKRCVFDTHVQARCVRTGYFWCQISLNPSGGTMLIEILFHVKATIYIREWGTVYTYTDTTCPDPTPTWVLTNTETFDNEVEVALPNDGEIYWRYKDTFTVDCNTMLAEHIVPVNDDIISENEPITLTGGMGFNRYCTGVTPGMGFTCGTPGYNFGTLGCGAGVAYVTIATSPCV